MKFDILSFSNLPNLQEINLGSYSFYKAGSFSLSGNNYSCSIDSLIFLISNPLRQDHIHSTILQNYLCRVFVSSLIYYSIFLNSKKYLLSLVHLLIQHLYLYKVRLLVSL